ncbi:MAG: F0F1 ATP synthase subunit alpha [Candidatus Omnitrophica bacterium]|nr:F0F1 ATP synthase subunit alpha [Candidatus Omnitrophota bacterium]
MAAANLTETQNGHRSTEAAQGGGAVLSLARDKGWFDVREVGRVVSVREYIIRVHGLPSCMNGQLVEFGRGGRGIVMGYNEREVLVLLLGAAANVRAGDEVYSRSEPFLTPVGDAFIGRVVTALGEPCDGGAAVEAVQGLSTFQDAPGVMERVPVKQALQTGLRIIDAGFPIAKGQRQLIIGDQMTGKTTIATDTILNQRGKNVLCIYCAVGQSHSSFQKVLTLLKERGAMEYTMVVAGIASAPLGEQFLAPYAACAWGEYFASKGRDVFIAFDDLSKHAWAYRQLSLLFERPPGREAYPGDIFYIHSQLLERAGKFIPELGGGTMTFFPIVATIQGDITGYIQTNIISITDGQLYLNTGLFQKGFKPAIDFGLSVSRIGNKAQGDAMKELSGKLRLEYLRYQELLQMTAMKSDLSSEAEGRLRRGEVISQLLIQNKGQPSSLAEQLSFLYAIRKGVLDPFSREARQRFKTEFMPWLQQRQPALVKALDEGTALIPQRKQAMDEALEAFIQETGLSG